MTGEIFGSKRSFCGVDCISLSMERNNFESGVGEVHREFIIPVTGVPAIIAVLNTLVPPEEVNPQTANKQFKFERRTV